jgi:hypothetical protein
VISLGNNKAVVDKMIDILAQQYREVLRKYEMNGNIDITELSNKIMDSLEKGNGVAEIQNTITNFFDERIESFDKRAGEIAAREGKATKHKKIMEDLKGLRGKFDKSCAEAIVKHTTEKENSQYLDIAEKGVLISPDLINKNSVESYKRAVETAKKFPAQYRPDNILESKILNQVNSGRNTRRILLDGVREKDQAIMADYDKMIAYYLVMGGDKPIKRFSRLEMSMKQYGVRPDLGVSIMKYGDKLTTRLEELLKEERKTPEEWDVLKNQVLHSFNVAESIGNRNVNSQEHKIWEERLIRLGILEKKIEKPIEQKKEETFRENLKLSAEKPVDKGKQGVLLDSTMLKRAQKAYEDTGAIPLGYKLSQDGKTVVSIASTLTLTPDSPKDRIKASKSNLSAEGLKPKEEQTTR